MNIAKWTKCVFGYHDISEADEERLFSSICTTMYFPCKNCGMVVETLRLSDDEYEYSELP